MNSRTLISISTLALCAVLAMSTQTAAQTQRYRLTVLGTFGGPQSYGDAGHNAANINNHGIAAGVADTATPDPFYPNFNPNFSALIGSYPFVYHAFTTTKEGTLVDLGGLPGGTDSTVSFITENGLVSGQALNGSIDPIIGWPASSAVLWKDGKIINLGTLGGYESQAGQVNSRGQVTGISTNTIPDPLSFYYPPGTPNETQLRAFLWDEKNGMQDIGTLGGPDAFAPLINESGQIAGFSFTSELAVDPFLWEKGRMIDLGTLGGTFGVVGGLFALNNGGQVVGQSNLAGDVLFHPFLWTAPGPMRDLGTLGGPNGSATTMNDNGEVVGFADTATGAFHAFLWRSGRMTDIGTLGVDCFSSAFGINAKGQVVGQSISCDFTVFTAFLWQDGQIIDLNVFVPAGSGLMLNEVEEINDHGEIFGIGTLPNGDARAFLLIPVGEDDPEGISATPENLAALAAKTAHLSANGSQGRENQPKMLAAWGARLARIFHIPFESPKN